MPGAWRGPSRAVRFRLYFAGQLISNTGSWFQNLAISLLAPLAGRLADTVPIRRILLVTSAGSVAVTIGLIEVLSRQEMSVPWLLGWLVLAGSFQGVERIAAQAFVYEMVGPDLLKAGAVMTSMYVSAARSIGPGLAGLSFAAFGRCFAWASTRCPAPLW